MALIIENGDGVPNANSYVTEAEATAFLMLRGRADWPADVEEQRKFLIRAADYLNFWYGWGLPLSLTQTMAIPNLGLDYVPQGVKTAQVLLAYEASQGELTERVDGPPIKKLREKLDGVGETETEYADDNARVGAKRFPLVDSLVDPYVVSSTGSTVQVARRLVG